MILAWASPFKRRGRYEILPYQKSHVNVLENPLTLYPPNFSIWIFTQLKLCLADAIHNFNWVKIIQIWQNGGQLFSNIADFIFNMFKRWYLMC